MNYHDPYAHLSDIELISRYQDMRDRAAGAPKDEHSLGNAYARWADQWMRLLDEMKRRGLETRE